MPTASLVHPVTYLCLSLVCTIFSYWINYSRLWTASLHLNFSHIHSTIYTAFPYPALVSLKHVFGQVIFLINPSRVSPSPSALTFIYNSAWLTLDHVSMLPSFTTSAPLLTPALMNFGTVVPKAILSYLWAFTHVVQTIWTAPFCYSLPNFYMLFISWHRHSLLWMAGSGFPRLA